ncbi:transposable element Tc3 transposase [Trichonephila clavipes]|uniref:Transposable element Tc3 transposase n=1 Tax=Trichonephila clavipes TaxID=2585209 RepID=A0A8X6T803_TRICX|nr:transposable element Tc3 transposase [Trichonephila clavipes]
MTTHIYRDVILEQHVRLFRGAMGAEFLFVDDNARPHRANIVDECLLSEDITERRLRRLVEMFRTDSSQSPPKKRDLFEGHKRPENKLRNQFLALIYSPDDFNLYIYQSDTKTSPSLMERKQSRPKTTL